MFIKMNRLTESMQDKYKLDESISDNIPSWLWKRMFATQALPYSASVKQFRNRSEYREQTGGHAYYNNVSKRRLPESSLGLYDVLLKNGFDLANAVVTEAEIPAKFPKVSYSDKVTHFFLLKNGQVYSPGINDYEIYLPVSGSRSRTFKGYSKPKLLDDTVAYAYVDWTLPENSQVRVKKEERAENQQVIRDLGFDRDIERGKAKNLSNYWGERGLDKSGYVIKPYKYSKKLSDFKFSRLSKTLEDIYASIVDIKKDYASYLSETPIRKVSLDPDEEFLSDSNIDIEISRKLNYIIEKYNSICIEIENAIRSLKGDRDQMKNYFTYSSIYDNINVIRKNIKQIENMLGDEVKVIADW